MNHATQSAGCRAHARLIPEHTKPGLSAAAVPRRCIKRD